MSKRNSKNRATARDRPRGAQGGAEKRSVVWLGDWKSDDDLTCAGYTSLAQSPEVSTAVDRIAALIGAMPIQLMRNGEKADVREYNGLSRIVDINPN
ncbi:MAG: phage portal protein, partial [Clostridia bacterium]|nr:phage portal protein [Clostridia bacterium]